MILFTLFSIARSEIRRHPDMTRSGSLVLVLFRPRAGREDGFVPANKIDFENCEQDPDTGKRKDIQVYRLYITQNLTLKFRSHV